jgi:pSer/pThr/pTyr-binding forkhead associated (FHA) protein
MNDPRQPAEAAGLPAQGPSPAPPEFVPMRLVLQPGGTAIELTHPDMLVGRHSEADVRLPLPDVSRRHCRFVCTGGRWQVLDLNSLNGVYVNAAPVQQAYLTQGDLVRIGGFVFAVDLPSAENADDPPSGILRNVFKALPRGEQERRRAS